MQLLRSYYLPINRPVSPPPTLFESLFRLPRLQDMKVRLFVSTLNALRSLILLPTCLYKACAVRGCWSSHPLWIGASRRADCPLLIGNLHMNNEPSQTNQPNQIANLTDHLTNSAWFPEGLLWSVNMKQILPWNTFKKQTCGKIGLGEFDAVESNLDNVWWKWQWAIHF